MSVKNTSACRCSDVAYPTRVCFLRFTTKIFRFYAHSDSAILESDVIKNTKLQQLSQCKLKIVFHLKGWYFGLDKYYEKESMNKFFDDKPQGPTFRATYTGAGLIEARSMLDASKRKADSTVGTAVLLLTDGYATDTLNADKEVELFVY